MQCGMREREASRRQRRAAAGGGGGEPGILTVSWGGSGTSARLGRCALVRSSSSWELSASCWAMLETGSDRRALGA